MNRLREIKSIAELKELIILHKESIKKAALPLTVVAALLFFWVTGSGGNDIEEVNEPVSEITSEASDDRNGVDEEAGSGSTASASEIYVDISGCVYDPGVYKLKTGTRLFQVIEKAGGLTPEADINSINQAEEVYDGQKILITSKDEAGGETYSGQATGDAFSSKININTADLTLLQNIPGVGPSTAQKIIDYRTTFGRFKSIEDIKNVSGIGEKTFEKMKEYITV